MPVTRITFREGQAAQPEALVRVAEHVRGRLTETDLGRVERPLFTGIGASYAALAVPVEILRGRSIAAHRVLADEITENTGAFGGIDLLVGVSQSGRSAETIAAFEAMARVPHIAVLNVVPSPLDRLAQLTLDLGNEPDSFASTTGFTGTVVALDLLADALSPRPATPDAARTHGPAGVWADIAAQVTATARHATEVITALSVRAARCVAADVVASGASRAAAQEGALLLREVARLPATASATRNYLHGEMESAGRTLHVVLGDGREIELARSLAAAGHFTLLITTLPVPPEEHLSVITLPVTPPAVRVVLETVALQELSAALSDERGVPIESFVFANDDTKHGGLDPADFENASPLPNGAP
ncbi:SIS domain-containing protein [Streptomyces sp. NPDC057137]|uniref:SIS domain-containing protein n=1 Tax=Streptomyces sp. NPDC057137 TaxID=3346030 RepID=UPI0036413027